MSAPLRFEVEVDAPRGEVWSAWTTEAGLRTFLAPEARMELRVDGPFEAYFMPEASEGSRGGEGCRILAFEPERMLSFTWNAPPEIPDIRRQFTHVTVRLADADAHAGGEADAHARRTRVVLEHDGWGEGGDWPRARAYFERAWGQVVMPRLVRRFAEGPIDWER